MSTELITAIFIGAILLGVMTGYPIGLVLGGITIIIGYFVMGPSIFNLMYMKGFMQLLSYPMLAIPLFIFMGYILGHTGIADKMYQSLYLLFSKVRGGLAVSTVFIGMVLAACVGVIGASIAILSVLALPSMLERRYNKSLACGVVCASGTLGILIPPSVMLVLYGPAAQISVGNLFMGAMLPGVLLTVLYSVYILVAGVLKKDLGPAAPPEMNVALVKKIALLISSLIPPAFLVLSVLGVIFFGIAAPTEAAAVGAVGSLFLGLVYRKLSLKVLMDSLRDTMRVTSFMFFIGVFATGLVGVFLRLGCGAVIENVILSIGGKWASFFVIMAVIFVLGMFIDWIGIIFIIVPIVAPIVPSLGFDPVWFAIMVCINLQMSFLTPPMAPAIFYLKGMVKPEMGISTSHIVRGVVPFIVLILVALGLCIIFPEIITFLPDQMIRKSW